MGKHHEITQTTSSTPFPHGFLVSKQAAQDQKKKSRVEETKQT